ncbi:hypothetical protein GH714_041681 [Hevea brasiliensis]|uniref:Uncharacterized protein n=1 Tax=Hevea brasiliensis TaxID=3981 RepID=A0A6A6MS10_HEVBR|nr:hypothetical protein GH714_041681 [Hevea brasiliensis]
MKRCVFNKEELGCQANDETVRRSNMQNGVCWKDSKQRKQGNAARSKLVMVGDTLKKATKLYTGKIVPINDFGDAQ